MSLYAGIDLGTSGIKVVLMNEDHRAVASAARPCPVDRPHTGWSQQDPDLWWDVTASLFDELAATHPDLMARLAAISLSGQMLGPVLLDAADRPVNPCILWNDQRAIAECAALLDRVPDIGWRTNGQPDPGLGAPKLLWYAQHMPQVLGDAAMLMLPKDYVRLCMTGERGSDYSDASGTMLMDCATRAWDDELLDAAGWTADKLPPLLESFEVAGTLLPTLCTRWQTPKTVAVVAGCGDNYAGAIGVGAATSGIAALSIGTSGVLSAVDHAFRPAPDSAVLTTPHAAPDTFLSMGVVMSATQSLDWIAALSGTPVAELMAGVEARVAERGIAGCPVARPSITGVRTPHNRPDIGGAYAGIAATADKVDMAYATIEGVAFQFLECFQAQRGAGVEIDTILAVGGGTRSGLWTRLIATLLDLPLTMPEDGDISACIGAAKLAKAGHHPADLHQTLGARPATLRQSLPDAALKPDLTERFAQFSSLSQL